MFPRSRLADQSAVLAFLERGIEVGFAQRGWPNPADNDGFAAQGIDDLPASEDQLPPTAAAQLFENRSRFRMLKEICARS